MITLLAALLLSPTTDKQLQEWGALGVHLNQCTAYGYRADVEGYVRETRSLVVSMEPSYHDGRLITVHMNNGGYHAKQAIEKRSEALSSGADAQSVDDDMRALCGSIAQQHPTLLSR